MLITSALYVEWWWGRKISCHSNAW